MDKKIIVELVYALPEKQELLVLEVTEGSTVEGVILQSGVIKQHPELDIKSMQVGLFGKKTKMAQKLREKDRIEIYRPLIADPKEVRRRRAAEGKALKKGRGEVLTPSG